jgi:fatty-acyl-CoA synthase
LTSFVRRLRAASILARSNLVPFERPDRLMRAAAAALPWGMSMAAGMAAAAARYPERTALIDDEGAVTYDQLWRQSDGVARRLVELGAGPGVGVGVLCRNHRGFAAAAIGVTKTSSDLVLLNTGFAGPQLADVVEAEGVRILVHDDEFEAIAAAVPAARLDEDGLTAAAASGRAARPNRRPGRTVILTSGTTGRPKGAARRADPRAIEGASALYERVPLRALDTTVVAAPLFHAWGLSHLLGGVTRNATTIVSRRFDPQRTLDDIVRHRARVLAVVPVMLQRILALGDDVLSRADTTSLQIIASSGSALGGRLTTDVLDRFGPVLYNIYGSTEVAVASIATPADLRRHPTTAGRRAPGSRVEVLDADGRPVPPETIGRIFVGSSARFEGYTSGAGKESQHGLLSSGDIGHFDRDGFLYVDGREDDMIVSGGENVYPFEVQELLAHHPAVAEVAVVGVPDAEFGQALAAFVAVAPGHTLDEEAVKQHVRGQLARFKVPRRVAFLDELPRNPTGKILTRELVSLAARPRKSPK